MGDVNRDGEIDLPEFVGEFRKKCTCLRSIFSVFFYSVVNILYFYFKNIPVLLLLIIAELMIPDVKEAEEEGKQKAKQVNDDLEVFETEQKTHYFSLSLNVFQDKVGTARMDLFFFVLFPILFTIFNVIYWIVFMFR